MNITKNMAMKEFSHIFNLSISESFSVNPIGIYSMHKDDKSYRKLGKPSWQNYNTNENFVKKEINVYFGLIKQHLSATYIKNRGL